MRLVNSPRDLDWSGLVNPWPAADLDRLAKARDKRGLLLAALSHLARHLPERQTTVSLADDAPLGTITIDAKHCTLCHACGQLCPTGALRKPGDAPAFLESACVQCGPCVNGCPERALTAEPRFSPDPHLTGDEVILKPASELFCCVACGPPSPHAAWWRAVSPMCASTPCSRATGCGCCRCAWIADRRQRSGSLNDAGFDTGIGILDWMPGQFVGILVGAHADVPAPPCLPFGQCHQPDRRYRNSHGRPARPQPWRPIHSSRPAVGSSPTPTGSFVSCWVKWAGQGHAIDLAAPCILSSPAASPTLGPTPPVRRPLRRPVAVRARWAVR